MESWDTILTDWVNLPPGSQVQSLYACLHDAELKSIKSDLFEQQVILEIEAFYLPDGLRVFLQLDEVKSARVNKYPPPYQSLVRPDLSFLERNQLAGQWAAKWREESMSWREFEEAQSTDPLNISGADLAVGEDGITLRIGGHLNGEKYDDLWCAAFLRAKKISAYRSDGQDFSLEQLVELGRQWWESFGSRQE